MVHGQNHWPFHHAKQIYFDLNLIYCLLIIRYTVATLAHKIHPPVRRRKQLEIVVK